MTDPWVVDTNVGIVANNRPEDLYGSKTVSLSLTCSVMAGPVAVMRPVHTRGSARRGPCGVVFVPSGRWPGL